MPAIPSKYTEVIHTAALYRQASNWQFILNRIADFEGNPLTKMAQMVDNEDFSDFLSDFRHYLEMGAKGETDEGEDFFKAVQRTQDEQGRGFAERVFTSKKLLKLIRRAFQLGETPITPPKNYDSSFFRNFLQNLDWYEAASAKNPTLTWGKIFPMTNYYRKNILLHQTATSTEETGQKTLFPEMDEKTSPVIDYMNRLEEFLSPEDYTFVADVIGRDQLFLSWMDKVNYKSIPGKTLHDIYLWYIGGDIYAKILRMTPEEAAKASEIVAPNLNDAEYFLSPKWEHPFVGAEFNPTTGRYENYYIVKFMTDNDMKNEGRAMNNCFVDGHHQQRKNLGLSDYYSVRDKNNKPLADLEYMLAEGPGRDDEPETIWETHWFTYDEDGEEIGDYTEDDNEYGVVPTETDYPVFEEDATGSGGQVLVDIMYDEADAENLVKQLEDYQEEEEAEWDEDKDGPFPRKIFFYREREVEVGRGEYQEVEVENPDYVDAPEPPPVNAMRQCYGPGNTQVSNSVGRVVRAWTKSRGKHVDKSTKDELGNHVIFMMYGAKDILDILNRLTTRNEERVDYFTRDDTRMLGSRIFSGILEYKYGKDSEDNMRDVIHSALTGGPAEEFTPALLTNMLLNFGEAPYSLHGVFKPLIDNMQSLPPLIPSGQSTSLSNLTTRLLIMLKSHSFGGNPLNVAYEDGKLVSKRGYIGKDGERGEQGEPYPPELAMVVPRLMKTLMASLVFKEEVAKNASPDVFMNAATMLHEGGDASDAHYMLSLATYFPPLTGVTSVSESAEALQRMKVMADEYAPDDKDMHQNILDACESLMAGTVGKWQMDAGKNRNTETLSPKGLTALYNLAKTIPEIKGTLDMYVQKAVRTYGHKEFYYGGTGLSKIKDDLYTSLWNYNLDKSIQETLESNNPLFTPTDAVSHALADKKELADALARYAPKVYIPDSVMRKMERYTPFVGGPVSDGLQAALTKLQDFVQRVYRGVEDKAKQGDPESKTQLESISRLLGKPVHLQPDLYEEGETINPLPPESIGEEAKPAQEDTSLIGRLPMHREDLPLFQQYMSQTDATWDYERFPDNHRGYVQSPYLGDGVTAYPNGDPYYPHRDAEGNLLDEVPWHGGGLDNREMTWLRSRQEDGTLQHFPFDAPEARYTLDGDVWRRLPDRRASD